MGFDDGNIILDSKNGAYYAGQTIFGKIKFHQPKVKTFRGIYVKVKGYAHVHWTSSHTRRNGDRDETYYVNHDANEEYFRTKTFLVGGESGEHTLGPGDHEFDFHCHIPAHCPSSYEGTYGHIRYELKVVVDRAFKLDQEKEASFRVIAPLDLNLDPTNREPIQFEFNDSYCCCCTTSGACETVVKLPVTGYTVGQVIPIELGCQNRGNVEIDKIKLKIVKKTTYHAHDEPDTRDEEETIQEVKKGPVPENTSRNWTVDMEVPVMDVNNVNSCRIIDIEYYFEVTVVPSGCHSKSESSSRIVIGDVPLKGIQDDVTNPLQHQMPNQPIPQIPTAYPVIRPTLGLQVVTTQPFANNPYPGPVSQYPNPNVFPSQNQPPIVTPFPGNPPYPGGNQPYPGGNQPYPGGNPPYPGGNPSYPGGNPPYPGGNPSYPGGNPPYPGGNPTYPGGNPPYPGGNASYPGGNPPYPGGNPSYPGGNPPYPAANLPMPVPAQPPRSPIGFKVEKSENQEAAPLLPYTNPNTPTRPVSPYSAPTAPALDDKSSKGTPPTKVPDTPVLAPQSPYNPEFMSNDNKP